MEMISDEIRDFVKRSYEDEYMDPKELLAIADRVDRELVELPRDRDGAPIHVGDTVYLDDGRKAEVTRIDLMPTNTCIVCWTSDKKDVAYLPSAISHKQTDSFERIARDLEDWAEGNISGSAQSFAGRIRRLAATKED